LYGDNINKKKITITFDFGHSSNALGLCFLKKENFPQNSVRKENSSSVPVAKFIGLRI
jgi:hypothetical protein